jgi:Tfp pilus assembly protein PilO
MRVFQIILFVILLLTSILGLGFSFYLFQENQTLQVETATEITNLKNEKNEKVTFQRFQKNEIANLFDDQAALNDDLVDEQRRLSQAANEYINYIDSSIRFLGGEPQILPTMNEEDLLKKKNELARTITDLRKISEENSNKKEQSSTRIQQLYLEAQEDRDNSTNDRDGIRGD